MYYRQPQYFKDFRCIGSDCHDNCCNGWRINWTEKEVDKLKNAENISHELKEIVETYFIDEKIKNAYKVQFDERGKCPCLTEDGWCRIQRELGAEYLSYVCMAYPRNYIISDNCNYRYCNMSCPETMKKLLHNEKSMDLINAEVKDNDIVQSEHRNTHEKLKAHPQMKYRSELLELFYEIIGDKKHDVEVNIILGALAAQSLTKLVDTEDYDTIPQAIKDIRAQIHNGAQLKQIENIKSNYFVKLGFLGQIVRSINPINIMAALTDNTGKLNIDLYLQGEKRLEETFKDNPFYMRNIALNLLLELAIPFKLEDKTIFENYCLFAAAFAAFKLNVIATAELGNRAEAVSGAAAVNSSGISAEVAKKVDSEKHVIRSATIISRTLCHNPDAAINLIELLHNAKLTTPGYIALLVK